MEILDETFGPLGWKCDYKEIKGSLFCTVSVFNEITGEWIEKQDVGVESNTEKEKGEASDAFKRACVKLGIGRELYTRIFIWISGGTEPAPSDGGRPRYKLSNPFESYSVSDMEIDDNTNKIIGLAITDSKNNVVFDYGTLRNRTGARRAPQAVSPAQREPEASVPTERRAEAPRAAQSASAPSDVCPSCGGPITAAEIGYSKRTFRAVLCRSCQANIKKKATVPSAPEQAPPPSYEDIPLPFDMD
jgi:hypothetical protein